MSDIDQDLVEKLYEKYADQLRAVKTEQRALLDADPTMKAQLDDLEAEITYLWLRDRQPSVVVEIGCLHGWSTSWILRALRDNGQGTLCSYDIHDGAVRHVPRQLADGRWRFSAGDVRQAVADIPEPDYLFIDAAHSARFARWYIADLFPHVRSGTPVSVHDVFHGARPWPFTEGAVLLDWLRTTDRRFYTASAAREPAVNRRLREVRKDLGVAGRVHTGSDDPMLFFTF